MAARQGLNPLTRSIGFSVKTIRIKEVIPDRAVAVGVDDQGNTIEASLAIRRTGSWPQIGELWIVDKSYGPWTLAAELTTGEPPVVTGVKKTPEGLLGSLLGALSKLGMIKDESIDGVDPPPPPVPPVPPVYGVLVNGGLSVLTAVVGSPGNVGAAMAVPASTVGLLFVEGTLYVTGTTATFVAYQVLVDGVAQTPTLRTPVIGTTLETSFRFKVLIPNSSSPRTVQMQGWASPSSGVSVRFHPMVTRYEVPVSA